MYIAQAFNYLHDWWRYIIGAIVVFAMSQLGALPFIFIAMMKAREDGMGMEVLDDPEAIMGILDSNLTLFLMLFSFAIGMLALWLVVKYFHKQPLKTVTTSRKKVDWGRIWFGFFLIAGVTTVLTILDYYTNSEDYVLQFNLVPFLILAAIALIMIPIQTSFEEYLFRGYLMQGIGTMTKNRWAPLLITSIVFGGLHIMNPEVEKLGMIIMVYYIGTGLFLGIITLMDEGMELALGFHAGNNIIAALLVTADWTVFQTNSVFKDISEPSAGLDVLAPVLIVYPIFIGIMAWRYKWKGWGAKLIGPVHPPQSQEQEESMTV